MHAVVHSDSFCVHFILTRLAIIVQRVITFHQPIHYYTQRNAHRSAHIFHKVENEPSQTSRERGEDYVSRELE